MTPTATKPTTYADVESALNSLNIERCDDRDSWLKIGQALHSWDEGPGGFDLWATWSMRSPKFKNGECDRMWRGFRPGKGITIATLFQAAKEDGWKPEKSSERREPAREPSRTQQQPARPAKAPDYFWSSEAEARAALAQCPRVMEHFETLDWLQSEYGLDPDRFNIANWWRFEHPRMGAGIVYEGHTADGLVVFKYKTFERCVIKKDGRRKRDTRCLFSAARPESGPGALFFDEEKAPLVIVGGEEKAAAAKQAGYAVLSPLTGEATLSPEWRRWIIQNAKDHPCVIFANDADKAGAQATKNRSEELAKDGYPKRLIRTVEWGEGVTDGYDLNDALKDGLDLGKLIQGAPCAFARRSLLTVKEILSLKLPDDDNLLDDRLMAEGEMTSVIGMGGIGKSRVVLQLAISCIMGWDWLGLRTHCKGRKWLILQTENSARRLTRDLANMIRGLKREDIDYISDRLIIQANLKEIDFDTSLADEKNIMALSEEVADIAPGVIVFDPLNDFFAGENLNDEIPMKTTVTAMRKIARASSPKTAIIAVHHARGGRQAAAGAVGWDRSEFGLGSKGLYRAVRAQINIAPGGEEDNPPLVVACGKNNNGKRFERLAARLDTISWQYEVIRDFDWAKWDEDTTSTRLKKRGRKQMDIDFSSFQCRMKNGGWHRQQDLVYALVAELGVGEMTVKRKLKELEEGGLLELKQETQGSFKVNMWRLR